MRYTTLLMIFISSFFTQAQQESTSTYIDASKLSSSELYSISTDGWAMLAYNGDQFLCNFSNPDYILHLSLTCKDASQQGSYLIEFSNKYRDGDYGGIDFTSSADNQFDKIVLSVDGIVLDNPFSNKDASQLTAFKKALAQGKEFTMQFYDTSYESDALEINRTIIFKLANSHLLEVATDCYD